MYFLDLLGTLAFAITGAFKAKKFKLSIFGAIFLGIITAVGGGTVRDLIINRTPLFYLIDPNYLLISILGAIITFSVPTFFKQKYSFFRLIDSIGLSVFAIIGVSIVYNHLFVSANLSINSFLSCIFLGMVTGFGGGVIRDAVMGDAPFVFRKGSNYAISSLLGAFSFYVLMFYNISVAIAVSMVITLTLREIISKYGIYKKCFKKHKI
ncbi:MAG: trimeric intracellular cation channel family protein [bacterium]